MIRALVSLGFSDVISWLIAEYICQISNRKVWDEQAIPWVRWVKSDFCPPLCHENILWIHQEIMGPLKSSADSLHCACHVYYVPLTRWHTTSHSPRFPSILDVPNITWSNSYMGQMGLNINCAQRSQVIVS